MNFENSIQNIVDSVSNAYGEAFFNRITQSLAQAVDADFCFIGRVNNDLTKCQTISTFAHGKHVDNFAYDLLDTPCAEVTSNGTDVYPENVAGIFNKDVMLVDMGIEAYIGASLKNSENEVLGLVVALFHTKIENPEPIHMLYDLFSGRIAAEIDSNEKTLALKQANENLEEKVNKRTKELEEAMAHMIEQEKFASIGVLVSGVAHEINTPLGICVTSESMIGEIINKLESDMRDDELTPSGLNQYISDLKQSSFLSQKNLQRAVSLVNNLKQVSANKSNLEKVTFSLHQATNDIVDSLYSVVKDHKFLIKNKIPEDMKVCSHIGDFQQIFSDFISNAASHAFTKDQAGSLLFEAKKVGEFLEISVKDDGKGIERSQKGQVFTPFYTTSRGQGATGLGLSIVYNIVKQKLGGDIRLNSQVNEGCEFIIKIPTSNLN